MATSMDEKESSVASLLQPDDGFGASSAPPAETGLCAPWKWFCNDPLNRKSFLLFLMFGALTLVWLFMSIGSGPSVGPAVFAGISAIVLSGYGGNNFRILLGLKAEVDKTARYNQNFRQQNMSLRQDVDKLSHARVQLSAVENSLKDSSQRLKENAEKFRQLDERLKHLSSDTIDGLSTLKDSSEKVMKSMRVGLIQHEKSICNKVFDALEIRNGQEGLSKELFDRFWSQMPRSYARRWEAKQKTFEDISGDDGRLDYDEFTAMVDEFAEQVALAADSKSK